MMINFSIQILYMLQNKRYDGNLIKGGKMNYLIGFVIFVEGLSILVDPAPPINIFGLPKGDVIPYGLNIPVGSVMVLFGLFFIYRELKK